MFFRSAKSISKWSWASFSKFQDDLCGFTVGMLARLRPFDLVPLDDQIGWYQNNVVLNWFTELFGALDTHRPNDLLVIIGLEKFVYINSIVGPPIVSH